MGVEGGEGEKSSENGLVLGAGVDCVEMELSRRAGVFRGADDGLEGVVDSAGGVEEAPSDCEGESPVPDFLFFLDFPEEILAQEAIERSGRQTNGRT